MALLAPVRQGQFATGSVYVVVVALGGSSDDAAVSPGWDRREVKIVGRAAPRNGQVAPALVESAVTLLCFLRHGQRGPWRLKRRDL